MHIEILREKKGMTLTKLAEKSGVSKLILMILKTT